MSAAAPICNGRRSQPLLSAHTLSSSPWAQNKRIITARHNDTAEGSRFTLTSDSQIDDYSSYVEGERFLVQVPQAVLIGEQSDVSGRGFADMRIEQRAEDVVLSFRLRQGATVSIGQNFNRLEVVFLTNDRTNRASDLPGKMSNPNQPGLNDLRIDAAQVKLFTHG